MTSKRGVYFVKGTQESKNLLDGWFDVFVDGWGDPMAGKEEKHLPGCPRASSTHFGISPTIQYQIYGKRGLMT